MAAGMQDARTELDGREFRRALGRYTTGVAVVTTRGRDGKLEGLTVNSFASVSLDPPLVLWSLRGQAPSLPTFAEAGAFAVNVLASAQQHLSRHFATAAPDKFAGVDHCHGLGGCPLLPGSIARFECKVEQRILAGDHTLFIGRVMRFEYQDGDPLAFFGGAYCCPTETAARA